ncbi:NucA/NucB deoxyribonuclease domain-containing protein [Actinokineospora inagensis]|uniref:NucA/NucB deoxyribonuclease domain-containing protein n=1 Tax=Actinokineospora inagensis TaxID=103730 RepID=UPI000408EE2D|nr:NucA/NucB deoxyribonuclease domain-containing protein [Actinokineospora inagensis]
MMRRAVTLLAAVGALLVSVVPAATSAAAAPASRVSAQAVTDLRGECAAHQAEAGRVQGWARSRFEQCHHYTEKVSLYNTNGSYLGYFDFELWILAFAYDGSRRVDYVTSVENVHQSTTMSNELTWLTIRLDCRGTDLVCPAGLSRADTIAGWYARSTMDTVTITSPDTAGTGPYKTVPLTETVGFTGEYRDGRTAPFYKDTEAINHVRFDSADSALGNGKYKGTVFTDHVPRFALARTGEGADEEARHVDDTLHHPERTFPAVIGKNAPGENAPLHRLMDPTKRRANHDAAVRLCTNVWGTNYAAGGMECDEYPFQSTYEGAAESTGNQPGLWNGSARPIPAADNGRGGTLLANFYGANRVLDNDAFFIALTG